MAPWLVSRVLSIGVMLAAVHDPFRGSRFTQLVLKWDGAYYVGIARTGYGPVDVEFPRWAFFPGLPGVIRLLREIGNDEVLVFALNQLAFLVALAGVYRIARRYGTSRAALLGVWALALFPASFVFSMTYPSALFLAASVWAFVLVEEHHHPSHDLWAGLLAAGATLLRPNGLIIAVSLAVAVRSARRIAVVVIPSVLALVAWSWYAYDRTGDALVYITTKERWQEIGAVDLVTGGAKWSVLPHVVLALGALVLVIWQRRRLSPALLVLTALALLPSLVTGMVGLARYANECFPPFLAAGQVLERWSTRVQVALLGASACGLVLFAFVVARYELVP
ncbi:MAG: glycosyltransferase family 39 protein [Acidimicrobiia bacterium]